MRSLRLGAALTVLWLVGACSTIQVDPLPDPIREPKELPAPAAGDEEGAPPPRDPPPGELRATRAPGVVIQRTVAESVTDRLGEDLVGDPVRVSFHDVPLVPFINEVFGEELGMSFVISPGLRDKTDLVTLRLTEPLPPRQLFAAARQVLREYGVDLRETEAGILTFVPSEGTGAGDVPLLVSGRALPEVPATHRTIFQLAPLKVVRGPQVRTWLKEAFEDRDLEVFEDPERNALLLKGSRDVLARALAMIDVLDQPLLRGRYGVVIEPVFMEARALADALASILNAEGYRTSVGAASSGNVILIALGAVNKVIAFAADPGTIEHVTEWARTLDTRQKETIEEGVFTYEVRNTQAAELTGTLNRILGLGAGGLPAPAEARNGGESPGGGVRTPRPGPAGDRIVVDKNRNVLLFRGTGREWAEVRGVIEKLDKAVPSVLIEVLIAEVTLREEERTGFEFLLRGGLGSRVLGVGTLGGLGLQGGGLGFTLNSGGERRAALNFLYEDGKIVIRSRPRLLVKSGETASIEVGNEIPVVTQTTRQLESDSPDLLQEQTTYRKTGVQLEIKPIVQANGLVDLQISQQLSETRSTETSQAGNPTILNRKISTSLTLRDGGSFLMGGLISGSQDSDERGVPLLGRLPGIGRLFRTDSLQEDRTELVVMVTPYVVADHEEGWELTRRIREQLELHAELAR